MNKLYRIGLDIGIGSVGFAVLENDPLTEDPVRILKMGVRTFNPNEVAKTGESTAASRRLGRGVRRRSRRKAFRILRVKNLLKNVFDINVDEDVQKLFKSDVYELRAKALDEKISKAELAKVVLNIFKRRGFKSTSTSQSNSDDGKLKSAISQNKTFLEENGFRTIGEAIFKSERFKTNSAGKCVYEIRNHSGDYKNCFHRDDLQSELLLILKKQQEYYAELTNENIQKIINIFMSQRNFDEGPGQPSPYSASFEVGYCTFEQAEKRAPKASYTFELFNALSKINSLKIDDESLSLEQKEVLYEFVKEKESLTFEKVRKLLNLDCSKLFNLCRYESTRKNKEGELSQEELMKKSEKSVFVTMKNSHQIAKKLEIENLFENKELIDEVALILSYFKSDSKRLENIQKNPKLCNLSNEQINNILTLNFDKFGSLSFVAMNKIIPFLFEGYRYDEACKKANYNHSSFEADKIKYLKGEKIEEELDDITSNVVKRAVNQTLRIVNEIIKEYGSPQYVNIELARELSRDFAGRREIEKRQKFNADENEKTKQILTNEFKLSNPKGIDVIKFRLYNEQDGKCMYSGKTIDESRLFEPNYLQIDHILPYSKSLNDGYNNKVLVLASENQNKGDRTPFEYFGSDEKKWNNFVARVNLLKNREKKRLLLKEKFGEKEQSEFIDRNLNDTKYMSKFLLNLFQKYLLTTPSQKYKRVIRSVNGAVTSYLRKCWGINKIREDGDIHHAIDASVIAMVTDGQIQKITRFNKFKEIFIFDKNSEKFINRKTGEVLSKEEKQELEKMNINILSQKLPLPYSEFKNELVIRSRANYLVNNFSDSEKFELAKLGYENDEIEKSKPIFVSRMKTVKTTGAIHQETMMSAREYDETKMLVKSVPIQALTLVEVPETIDLKDDLHPEFSIKDYYRPKDDRLLYLKLKNYLFENKKIPENVVFFKPKKDGSDGPVVKTVKIYQKSTSCVITKNGAAANDKMHRVDVFEKNNQFYLCPIYMSDVYAKRLPNKVIQRDKEWLEIDDSFNFKFSLYQNDLVKVTSKKEIVLNKNFNNPNSTKDDKISSKEWLLYYGGTGISTASITLKTHDNCYIINSLGVKTLLNMEKYYVDIMGNIYKAPKEERKGF